MPRPGQYISIRLPVRALAPRVADLDSAYGRPIPAGNAALRLLIRYLDILEDTDGFAALDLCGRAVAHIHDLATLALGASSDAAGVAENRGVREARFCAIKADIANHLGDTNLSLATLAMRHQVMPRYLQRLFEGEGTTFTEYMLAQRLARAYRVLADPHYADDKISTIAYDGGFSDLSYFNRTFRRRYGMTPSDLRAAAGADWTASDRVGVAIQAPDRCPAHDAACNEVE